MTYLGKRCFRNNHLTKLLSPIHKKANFAYNIRKMIIRLKKKKVVPGLKKKRLTYCAANETWKFCERSCKRKTDGAKLKGKECKSDRALTIMRPIICKN